MSVSFNDSIKHLTLQILLFIFSEKETLVTFFILILNLSPSRLMVWWKTDHSNFKVGILGVSFVLGDLARVAS